MLLSQQGACYQVPHFQDSQRSGFKGVNRTRWVDACASFAKLVRGVKYVVK